MQLSSPERLSPAGQHFDLLVIGGGINGVAIARECARAGKRTLIVEQHDFASGTTSRATRIIHGGLRYLEHGEIGLVRESLRERDRLLCQSPHLVRPLQFLLALPRERQPFMRSALAVRTGLWLYHRWAGVHFGIPRGSREFERQLDAGGKWSVYSYDDAQCEFPERLVAEWLAEAMSAGAFARNYTECLEIESGHGRVRGARLRDTLSGAEFRINCTQAVNASGPWADLVAAHSGAGSKRMIGGVRGSHIVLPKFSGCPAAAVYTEALDGRPFFVIPWNGQVLVGTTEVEDSGNPGDAEPSAEESEYLFDSFLRLFPSSGLSKADVRYSFAGVRPLPFSPGEKMSAVTRRHLIHDHKEDGLAGLLSIVGGKLTTAASLAREVARKLGLHVPEPANVMAAPAPVNGIASTFRQWARTVACRANIPENCAHAVAGWHGRRALAIACSASADERLRAPICEHSSHIVAEALEAAHHEAAVTLADILLRRVPLALGPCWSERCSEQAATRIGHLLGWNEIAIGKELERFEQERVKFLHPREQLVMG